MRKMAYTFAAILLAAVFGLTGCGGDFNAAGYMQAVLDERLQGNFRRRRRSWTHRNLS